MKAETFQPNIRGTVACMKILMMDIKGCEQLMSNYTYFADIWFSGVETAEWSMTEGLDSCVLVKTIHKFVSSYIIKVNERLSGRVISYSEYYSKSSW